jgi:hypothetical protein
MQNNNGISYKHLKDEFYYSELYDSLTIEECQRWENKEYPESLKEKNEEEKLTKVKEEYFHKVIIRLAIYFLTADRAAKKSETIQEWMKRDQVKDEKVASALEPKNIRCLGCSSFLVNYTSRDLMDNHAGQDAVLFMFECGKCHKRRAFWENGKEWEYKPKCTKCQAEVISESTKKDSTITTQYSCSHCGHIETDTMDLTENKEEKADPNFDANRKKYCIPEQEGVKIIRESQEMKELLDKWEDKDKNKDLYDAVGKIQKLTIVELQTLLNPLIEKAGYTKLEFEKPDLQKDVVIGFSLQDAKSGRGEYDSIHNLQRLIKEALRPTNWRLMSDGVNYRLGFLQGRLRGVEGEEKLRELVERSILKESKKSETKKL